MKLTPAQQKVVDAFQCVGGEKWHTWQTLGMTGRSAAAFAALARNGVLIKRPYIAGYKLLYPHNHL